MNRYNWKCLGVTVSFDAGASKHNLCLRMRPDVCLVLKCHEKVRTDKYVHKMQIYRKLKCNVT